MKGIFLYNRKFDPDHLTGIDKKVMAQINIFKSAGLDCKLLSLDSGINETLDKQTLKNQIKYRMPFSNMHPHWAYKDDFDGIDFLYMRRPAGFTVHAICMLRRIKKNNPHIKILVEIPTFPYDKELKMTWKDYPIYLKDRYNRRKLNGLVDRAVIICGSDIEQFFNIPVIRLWNGIDLKSVRPKKIFDDDVIDLCAVAMFAKWHGYERILYGLRDYYKNGGKRKIILHLIGKGAEYSNYSRIVNEEHLQQYVRFYGMKTGKELDEIYDRMDIGLDVFGMYRKNLSIAYSLKSREYLGKGIPIISGCPTDLFLEHKDFKYYCEFKNDNSIIDMAPIIRFYDEIYSGKESREEIVRNIRRFAEEYCDITKTMKGVTDYLLNE